MTTEPEVDEISASSDDDAPSAPEPRRSRLPGILVAVATVIALVSVTSTWVRVQALDTDEWVSLSSELLEEPEVQAALSAYLVDQLYAELDVAGEMESILPESLKGLAGPVAAAVRSPAVSGVDRLLDSPRLAALWTEANRVTHQTIVNILRDETRTGISTADGVVTLELGELMRAIGEDLGLSGALLDKAPEGAGQIVLFESDALEAAQKGVAVLDFVSWFLFVLVVGLYALAVYLAPGDRARVVRNIGLGLIIAGVIILLIRAITVQATVDAIVENPSNESVARVTAYVFTGLLGQMAWSGIIYGVVFVLFSALLGDHPWAVATRRTLAPATNASAAALAGGTVVLVLLLVLWSPGRAFKGWTTALVLIALVVGAVLALRARTQREFPEASFSDVGDSIKSRFSPDKSAQQPVKEQTPETEEAVSTE